MFQYVGNRFREYDEQLGSPAGTNMRRADVDLPDLEWRELVETGRRALRRTWDASARLSASLVATSFLSALLPAALTALAGLVVTDVESAVSAGEGALVRLLPWLVLISGVVLISGILDALRAYARSLLGQSSTC